MSEYLLAVHHGADDPIPNDDDMQRAYAAVNAFNEKLQASGAWVFAGGLLPPTSATVVRAQGDEILLTDGPYSEAKEQLGGFWIIQAADLDEALAWAKEATVACANAVEVRPFQTE